MSAGSPAVAMHPTTPASASVSSISISTPTKKSKSAGLAAPVPKFMNSNPKSSVKEFDAKNAHITTTTTNVMFDALHPDLQYEYKATIFKHQTKLGKLDYRIEELQTELKKIIQAKKDDELENVAPIKNTLMTGDNLGSYSRAVHTVRNNMQKKLIQLQIDGNMLELQTLDAVCGQRICRVLEDWKDENKGMSAVDVETQVTKFRDYCKRRRVEISLETEKEQNKAADDKKAKLGLKKVGAASKRKTDSEVKIDDVSPSPSKKAKKTSTNKKSNGETEVNVKKEVVVASGNGSGNGNSSVTSSPSSELKMRGVGSDSDPMMFGDEEGDESEEEEVTESEEIGKQKKKSNSNNL